MSIKKIISTIINLIIYPIIICLGILCDLFHLDEQDEEETY